MLTQIEATAPTGSRQLDMFGTLFPQQTIEATDNPYLREWFAPQALHELLMFRSRIHQYHYQDLLKVILSRSARSARLITHFDLDFPKKPQVEPYYCYKHKRMCQPTTTALQVIRRYSLDTIARLKAYAPLQTQASIEMYHQDSSKATGPLVDGIITSPPYVGLIDYHEQHRYAYELLELEDRRMEEIGAAKSGTSKKAKMDYQQRIIQVFKNVLTSVKTGGYLVVIAGDKHHLYDNIATEVGVSTEAILERQVTRRTGRRSTEFYESVFIWRKLG